MMQGVVNRGRYVFDDGISESVKLAGLPSTLADAGLRAIAEGSMWRHM